MNGQEIKLEDTGSIDGGPDSVADDGVYTAFLPCTKQGVFQFETWKNILFPLHSITPNVLEV